MPCGASGRKIISANQVPPAASKPKAAVSPRRTSGRLRNGLAGFLIEMVLAVLAEPEPRRSLFLVLSVRRERLDFSRAASLRATSRADCGRSAGSFSSNCMIRFASSAGSDGSTSPTCLGE